MFSVPACPPFSGSQEGAIARKPPRPPKPLTAEQISRAEIPHYSIPKRLPASYLRTSLRVGSPRLERNFSTSPQIRSSPAHLALNLGTLIRDGFLAARADRQQVKNVRGENQSCSRTSRASEQEFVGRNNSIADFADGRRWEAWMGIERVLQSEVAMPERPARRRTRHASVARLLAASLEIVSNLGAHTRGKRGDFRAQPAVSEFSPPLDAFPAKV